MERTPFDSILWSAEVLEVLDGDTVSVLAKGPWFGRCELRLRLLGVQAPETNGIGKRRVSTEESVEGYRAKVALEHLLLDIGRGRALVRTVRKDPYDLRYDGEVFYANEEGGWTRAAPVLVRLGLACVYDGHGKAPTWVESGRWRRADGQLISSDGTAVAGSPPTSATPDSTREPSEDHQP